MQWPCEGVNETSDMSESHLIFSREQPMQDGAETSPTIGEEKLSYNLENNSKMNSSDLAIEKPGYNTIWLSRELN